jgi:hypothetical protein
MYYKINKHKYTKFGIIYYLICANIQIVKIFFFFFWISAFCFQ